VHYPLHPDTPAEGLTLDALFRGRTANVAAMHARMQRLMEAEGLPYGERTHTYNSRLAQEIGAWGEREMGNSAIHDALFRAYFVEGRNIGNAAELVAIAHAAGLPQDEARAVIETRRFKAAVDADWAKSAGRGVTGVPTFMANDRMLVGAQPYETLAKFVVQSQG
jgi:predicted DsbA family dithiol-disulfide isomerase